jgi:hypothetical protein
MRKAESRSEGFLLKFPPQTLPPSFQQMYVAKQINARIKEIQKNGEWEYTD